MPTVILVKGLPASGKTTWAREWVAADPARRKRVNRDALRWMFNDYRFSREAEAEVTWARDALVDRLVGQGYDVVVDETNLDPANEERIRRLVGERAAVEVRFFDVGLDECLARNAARPEPERVPSHVIKRMHRKWLHDEGARHRYRAWTPGLPTCVVCDVDGTLAIHNGRSPYDTEKAAADGVNEPVLRALRALWEKDGSVETRVDAVAFVSGRDERFRELTEAWLADRCGFPAAAYGTTWHLFMRAADDKRNDGIVKAEIAERDVFPRWNVLCAFDDRDRVVKAWRALGVPCFQVCEGNF